jgi:Acyl-CoA carboxylase epsilon subunit
MTADEGRPLLRIVRGEPTDDELAAVVVALTSLAAGAAEAPPRSPWRSWGRSIRPLAHPSPGAWRASGLPR